MKDLAQVAVIRLGFLDGSISLAVLRSFTHTKVVDYPHEPSKRDTARQLAVACKGLTDDASQI